jgi:hypothetical protein
VSGAFKHERRELAAVRLRTELKPMTVSCQECGRELAGDSPELPLELTDDDEPIIYCEKCWEREFGAS